MSLQKSRILPIQNKCITQNAFKHYFAINFLTFYSAPHSQTLIDYIFSNKNEVESFSGNMTTTISDHYAQFLLLKDNNLPKGNKERKLVRDYKKNDKKPLRQT